MTKEIYDKISLSIQDFDIAVGALGQSRMAQEDSTTILNLKLTVVRRKCKNVRDTVQFATKELRKAEPGFQVKNMISFLVDTFANFPDAKYTWNYLSDQPHLVLNPDAPMSWIDECLPSRFTETSPNCTGGPGAGSSNEASGSSKAGTASSQQLLPDARSGSVKSVLETRDIKGKSREVGATSPIKSKGIRKETENAQRPRGEPSDASVGEEKGGKLDKGKQKAVPSPVAIEAPPVETWNDDAKDAMDIYVPLPQVNLGRKRPLANEHNDDKGEGPSKKHKKDHNSRGFIRGSERDGFDDSLEDVLPPQSNSPPRKFSRPRNKTPRFEPEAKASTITTPPMPIIGRYWVSVETFIKGGSCNRCKLSGIECIISYYIAAEVDDANAVQRRAKNNDPRLRPYRKAACYQCAASHLPCVWDDKVFMPCLKSRRSKHVHTNSVECDAHPAETEDQQRAAAAKGGLRMKDLKEEQRMSVKVKRPRMTAPASSSTNVQPQSEARENTATERSVPTAVLPDSQGNWGLLAKNDASTFKFNDPILPPPGSTKFSAGLLLGIPPEGVEPTPDGPPRPPINPSGRKSIWGVINIVKPPIHLLNAIATPVATNNEPLPVKDAKHRDSNAHPAPPASKRVAGTEARPEMLAEAVEMRANGTMEVPDPFPTLSSGAPSPSKTLQQQTPELESSHSPLSAEFGGVLDKTVGTSHETNSHGDQGTQTDTIHQAHLNFGQRLDRVEREVHSAVGKVDSIMDVVKDKFFSKTEGNQLLQIVKELQDQCGKDMEESREQVKQLFGIVHTQHLVLLHAVGEGLAGNLPHSAGLGRVIYPIRNDRSTAASIPDYQFTKIP